MKKLLITLIVTAAMATTAMAQDFYQSEQLRLQRQQLQLQQQQLEEQRQMRQEQERQRRLQEHQYYNRQTQQDNRPYDYRIKSTNIFDAFQEGRDAARRNR